MPNPIQFNSTVARVFAIVFQAKELFLHDIGYRPPPVDVSSFAITLYENMELTICRRDLLFMKKQGGEICA
jgi:hypothetical protein